MNPINANARADMRVAVVHDWLTVYGGAEKVLQQILNIWPHADLFSVIDFFPESERGALLGKRATTSFLQRMPFARTKYRTYLPLMPLAIEQLDLSGYDLIVSSSYAVAKGVITGADQIHVSYVHTPIRYAWEMQHAYLKEAGLMRGPMSWVTRALLHYVRMWDMRTAHGVDHFMANSEFVARRIRKTYNRSATVVYPPIDVSDFQMREDKDDFYLVASRLVPYKKANLIVEAFAKMPDRKLVVIGDGPQLQLLKDIATPNVTIMGHQPKSVLIDHFQRARAFVFAAEEDFGIAPMEAQACGTPVIAFGKGGCLETVIESESPEIGTGLFFHEQTADAIADAVRRFESGRRPSPKACRDNAARFSAERFRRELHRNVMDAIKERDFRRFEEITAVEAQVQAAG